MQKSMKWYDLIFINIYWLGIDITTNHCDGRPLAGGEQAIGTVATGGYMAAGNVDRAAGPDHGR